MAYRAEIEIAVRGARQLKDLQNEIKRTSEAVDQITKEINSVGNLTAVSFKALSGTLSDARQAFNNAARGSDAFGTAINTLIRTEREYNNELRERNSLLAQARAAQTAAARTVSPGPTGFSAEKFGPQVPAGTGRQGDPAFASSPVAERLSQQLRDQAKLKASLLALDEKSTAVARERLSLSTQLKEQLNDIKVAAKTGPREPEGFSRAAGQESARKKLIMQEGAQFAAQQEANRKATIDSYNKVAQFAKKNEATIFGIRAKNIRSTLDLEFDKIAKQAAAEGKAADKLIAKRISDNKKAEADFDKRLDRRVKARLKAAADVRRAEKRIANEDSGRAAAGRKKRNDAISSGIIGGAFPLLFGQGPAAAVGGGLGGFGGGLAGGQLGFGLSLVGTQIGAAVDQVITSITTLSSSLREPTAALTALGDAGIKVNSSVALQIQQLESAGKAYEAQALLLDTVAEKLGVDAVAQLQALDDAQEQTQQHISDFKSALIAELLPALTAAAQGINVLAGTLTKLSNIKVPIPGGEDVTLDIPKLIRNAALTQLTPGGPGIAQAAFKGLSMLPKPERQAPELTPTQKLAQQAKQLKATTDVGSLRLENEITELTGKNLQRNNDLTDATVVANKRLIISKTQQLNDNKLSAAVEEKRLNNSIDSNTLAVEGLQRDKNRIEANNQNLQLTNSIVAAQEAKNKKLGSGASKLAKQAEQLARQEQQARNFTASLERQLAQSRVAGSQQAQKLRIEARYEQTVERIAKLKNQDSATEQRSLADQIRSTALANLEATQARKQAEAIRSAVAPIKGIREGQEASLAASKEYNRLLMEGVLPSEAKRIVEFNKQVEQLLNQKTEAISLLELDIARAQTNGATTTALQEQLDLLKQQKGAIESEAAKGPGKSDTSDRKTVEDRVAQLQGELTEMTKLGNVAIAVADNVGSAFGAAFQGVINGSKTTQEALADMLKSVGESFVAMAAEIIVKQLTMIALQAVLKALGGPSFGGGGGGGTIPSPTMPGGAVQTGLGLNIGGIDQGIGPVGTAANGGPVKGGQPYLIGERGPELFVPGQSGGVMRNEDMRSLMGRSPASGGAASMNFSFETTSIGGTEYVSREQLESAMAVTRKQASNDGAKRGMNMTLDKMQNSPRTRTRIGLR